MEIREAVGEVNKRWSQKESQNKKVLYIMDMANSINMTLSTGNKHGGVSISNTLSSQETCQRDMMVNCAC